MNRSLILIVINRKLPFISLLFNIFVHICFRYFCVHSNPPLNVLQLTVLEVLMFNENTNMLPPGDSSDLYPVNNDTTEEIKLLLFMVPLRNQILWVGVVTED